MKVTKLSELRVWQLAGTFARAVSAILDRPSFRHDPRLRDQLGDSSVSVLSNISEGFGQSSDRAFANYLRIARSSNNEAVSQLAVACWRHYITDDEFEDLERTSEAMGKGLTVLIGYLCKEDRKARG
jgi:four helix bundle protein